jgi:cysteine dioxygenase
MPMEIQRPRWTNEPVFSPEPVPVEQFVSGIEAMSHGIITKQGVYDYLIRYEIRRDDIERYKTWRTDRHTRNKIFRNDQIEVMLLCWPIGAVTPLHTHNGQLGWMTMLEGKLEVDNFRKLSCDKPENEQVVGMDCLAGATKIDMQQLDTELATPGGPLNTVDKTQTIHRIKNLTDWNERAVSMHVYSRPIDSCVVFDMDAQRCFRRDLKYEGS